MAIDANAVQRALQAKGARGNCPTCGQSNWTLGEDLGFLGGFRDGSVLATQGVPTYTLICNNCGFLRLHAQGVVDS